jgi:2-oxoglutarate dehydrogenase E2 component (dihydrolipoamide succinyltransferase)
MDLQVVTMPKLGESVTEGTITAWLKSVGDRVELDDPLFEVSTDKVDSEIPSAFEGTLLEILVPEGETVGVDTPIARIGPAEAAGAAPAPPPTPALATVGAPTVAPAPPGGGNGGRAMVSPVVRRLAAEHSIDTATVQGTGEGGRIMREDIEGAIAAGTPGLTPTPAQAPAAAPAPGPASAPAAKPAAPAATDSRAEVQPLSRVRLVTAERMVESKRISPHVWTSIEVDLERVEETRQRHKDRFRKEEGVRLTYLAFIARAVCDALRAFPAMNSSVDIEAKTQTFHRYVNLGIAVDLDGKGLVAPVIRDADSLNLRGMARAIRQKADGAHAGRLAPDDYSGSTFTITNPGPFGDYASAPIINQPNVGILSTNMVSRRPTVVGNAIAIHHMTILGISYDHRAIDGVAVSQFLRHIKDALEQRDWEAELG